MRIELWSYDEYGSGSIVSSADSLEKAVLEAKKFVTKANVENALAVSEREKAWEAYFPVVIKKGKISTDMLYGGNKRNGKHQVWVKDKKKESYALEVMPEDTVVRFMLGEVTVAKGKEKLTDLWFLKDHKGNLVEGLGNTELENKTQLFVKILP